MLFHHLRTTSKVCKCPSLTFSHPLDDQTCICINASTNNDNRHNMSKPEAGKYNQTQENVITSYISPCWHHFPVGCLASHEIQECCVLKLQQEQNVHKRAYRASKKQSSRGLTLTSHLLLSPSKIYNTVIAINLQTWCPNSALSNVSSQMQMFS